MNADGIYPMRPLRTAVLFLVFNRPDTTSQVFEAIRRARPPRLYVASDGPRLGRTGEAACVEAVRKIATAVDWPCDVNTLFRKDNLGCKLAVSDGITWFFKHEEQGIILEDDCLPSQSFFWFCEYILDKYKENSNVWHINGNNFNAEKNLFCGYSYGFSAIPQVWGWATWRNKWDKYIKNPFYLYDKSLKLYNSWSLSKIARYNKFKDIELLKKGLNSWGYQWQIVVLNAGGLCVCPSVNLISNVGDGDDATHTKIDNRMHLPIYEMNHFVFNKNVVLNKKITSFYERKMNLRSVRTLIKNNFLDAKVFIKKITKIFLRYLLFGNRTKIVVASTGRSGSTMLFDAIVSAFIANNSSLLCWFFSYSFLKEICSGYESRIDKICKFSPHIIKTHDIIEDIHVDKANFIFVYGDPLESVQSVEIMSKNNGMLWFDEHQYHLRAVGDFEDLYKSDVLNFEHQIISWTNIRNKKIKILKYEELWDKVNEISEFVGFVINLPERKARAKKNIKHDYNRTLFTSLRSLLPR